ncbi:type VI secretion system tip protein VgrG [Rodentibacter caecimuris]|uniref:type VI secretion system Vgr family protein n=4 Tax=Rodentibacter caecimuris TaxID=1796644 RepID=UPI0010946B89|nr:type VI secretion system tip protein TssI/VgrG [Pasteurella caecimuris]TGY47959.1 type VI secretion system tip protein VgrG [Pasteurella caecimuris]
MATQSNYRYTLDSGDKHPFDVVSFQLTEGLSEPFKLELMLSSFDPNIPFSALMDKAVTFTFWQGDKAVRYVNGIVTGFGLGKTGFVRTHYNMVVEPALVRAGLQSDSRIFQHQNSEKIIRTLLQKNRVEKVTVEPLQSDWEREYCVQYRETDVAFIERLAAEEGWYYYFKHDADSHELCFAHQSRSSPILGTLTYNANPAGERPFASLWQFEYRRKMTASRQTLRDYTFLNPSYNLEHQHTAQSAAPNGSSSPQSPKSAVNSPSVYEHYDYPGRYKRDEQGNPFSRYRLEAELAQSETAQATGDDMRVIPGYGFRLEGHHSAAFNQEWLVVRVEHRGSQIGVLEEEAVENDPAHNGNHYENTLFLIPHHKPWRSPPKPRPIIRGSQVAHVVGPEGEEIYCDEWGRVKLQFPWDRRSNGDEHSSCWIRVIQGWAGAQYGNMMIPRIGDEVLVKYLNGDPDQPIVVGRTYHSTTEPPYKLPEHKTRTTIKSKTHKGNGFNELRFEDENGQEEIFLHAEKDLNHLVKHDETTQVGYNRTEQVNRNETVHIGNNRTETVNQDEALTINRDQIKTIGRNRITKVEQDDLLNINNNRYVNVHGDTIIHVGNELNIDIAQNGSWQAGELFEQICEQFDLEGYETVEISGPGGSIVINREGIELIGNVYIEGELIEESGEAEEVTRFETEHHTPNSPIMQIQFFQSPHSTAPLVGMPYTLYADGKEVGKGITDDKGEIEITHEEQVEKYEVKFINGAHYEIPMIEGFEEDSEKDEVMNHGFYLDQGKEEKEALKIAKEYAKLIGKLV